MNKFLIVVDMQNDFIDGCLGSKEAENILPNVKNKIIKYSKEGYKIIFTRDTHDENYLNTFEGRKLPVKHCIINSHGWKIANGLDLLCKCEYINKNNFGFLNWTDIIKPTEPSEIELIGVCTDICVISNALIIRTLFPNTEIKVDSSCCAGTSIAAHNSALASMKSCQIDVL